MTAHTSQAELRHFPPADQPWLAALAGSQAAENSADPQTLRHSQQLRSYFAQRDAAELESPLGADSEARMLAKLHRQDVFRAGHAQATGPAVRHAAPAATSPTLGQRLAAVLDWLLPSGPGAGPRYALVAGVALAVMVVPVFLGQAPQPFDDNTIKSTPTPGQGAQLMLVAQPAQQLQQLQAALQAFGLATQVQAQGPGYRLQASVPPTQQAVVQSALMPWGLVVPASGVLVVNILPTGQP
jgi:hypothetical protein